MDPTLLIEDSLYWELTETEESRTAMYAVVFRGGNKFCGDSYADLGDDVNIDEEHPVTHEERRMFAALRRTHPVTKHIVADDAFFLHAINIVGALRFDKIDPSLWEVTEADKSTVRSLSKIEPRTYAELHTVGFKPMYVYLASIEDGIASVVTINPISNNRGDVLVPSYRHQRIPERLLIPSTIDRVKYFGHVINIEDVPVYF